MNVAPNRDGLIDDNAIEALKEVGKRWQNEGQTTKLPPLDLPVISGNLALGAAANSSWSDDMDIMDFANDDNYKSSWRSNSAIAKPWYEIDFKNDKGINAIVIAETKSNIDHYILEYWDGAVWKKIADGTDGSKIKIHRFHRVWTSKVRIRIEHAKDTPSIAEFQVFDERRD